MKCPDCGAPILSDSRFCSHCGAKLDDGVKRVEVNIHKRIEDIAEIKRAGYEEKESELRQKKAGMDVNSRRIKRWSCLILLGLCALMLLYILIFPASSFSIFCVIGACSLPFLLGYIIYQLVTGKW